MKANAENNKNLNDNAFSFKLKEYVTIKIANIYMGNKM
jgi:hypothetical protein